MDRSNELPGELLSSDPSPAAVRLAMDIAERVNAIVPEPFRVFAERGCVLVYHGEEWRLTATVGELPEELGPDAPSGERYSFAWYVASNAEHVLSSVQDVVTRTTTDPWPLLPGGGMARSGARTDGKQVFLCYGPDNENESQAVSSFAPISLAELRGRAKAGPPNAP